VLLWYRIFPAANRLAPRAPRPGDSGGAHHPTLDWLNTYGMRWLMPFSGRWFYGDAVFIVDPGCWWC